MKDLKFNKNNYLSERINAFRFECKNITCITRTELNRLYKNCLNGRKALSRPEPNQKYQLRNAYLNKILKI